jgi:hypothetical protein
MVNHDQSKAMTVLPEKGDLPLHTLHLRHPGLTEAIGESYVEAAGICLDRHFSPPIDMRVRDGDIEYTAKTNWSPVDELQRRAWANAGLLTLATI